MRPGRVTQGCECGESFAGIDVQRPILEGVLSGEGKKSLVDLLVRLFDVEKASDLPIVYSLDQNSGILVSLSLVGTSKRWSCRWLVFNAIGVHFGRE